jgi:hypothetical protein
MENVFMARPWSSLVRVPQPHSIPTIYLIFDLSLTRSWSGLRQGRSAEVCELRVNEHMYRESSLLTRYRANVVVGDFNADTAAATVAEIEQAGGYVRITTPMR